MKAILIEENKSLTWGEFDDPVAGENEVLIKVAATAINRADLVQRSGGYPPPPGASPVLGLECAGEVVAVGSGCKRYRKGDRVCALLAGGGYAEYAAVDEGSVLPVPGGMDLTTAAGIPEVYATAWLNLFMEAGAKPGDRVLLHAGASGVGTAGIQMCSLNGIQTFVTVGAEPKLQACLELGASGGSNRHDGPFVEAVRAFAPDGVDIILDPVGASYLSDNIQLLALNGRLVLIGLMGGASAELNLGALMMKRARIIGSTLRARPVAEKAALMAELEKNLWSHFASGQIAPVIEAVFPIEKASEAHGLIASDSTTGKVILQVDHSQAE